MDSDIKDLAPGSAIDHLCFVFTAVLAMRPNEDETKLLPIAKLYVTISPYNLHFFP